MEDGEKKKCLVHRFLAEQKIENVCGKKVGFGAADSMSNKFVLVPRHTLTTGLQKCL